MCDFASKIRTVLKIVLLASMAALAAQSIAVGLKQDAVGKLEGKYPQIVADSGRIWLLSTVAGQPRGQNLVLHQLDPASLKTVASWRVNPGSGTVRVTGESSALLLQNSSRAELYAIWNEDDPRHKFANRLMSATFNIAQRKWTAPLRINDDSTPTTHSFQAATVDERGSIHVAWIDRRHNKVAGPNEYSGGGDHSHGVEPDSSLYYTRSTDGGKTYQKNRLISGGVCACCRIGVAAAPGAIVVAWRSIQTNGVRDIALSTSTDAGNHWTQPAVAVADNWVISGCPHSGPALAFSGSTLYMAWMTGATGGPKVRIATSQDQGRSFSIPVAFQGDFYYSNHPRLASLRNTAVTVHEGSDAENRTRVFLARVGGGNVSVGSRLVALSGDGTIVSYPVVAADEHGVVIAWTASSGEKTAIHVVRERE
jgi:hypothetical protein